VNYGSATARLVLGGLLCGLSYGETHGLFTTLILALTLIALEIQTWIIRGLTQSINEKG
jgi:hypothetical protein